MPAFRKLIAIPVPIVPAPITAADLMGLSGVDSGMSATLAAARSAKNACLNAFETGPIISSPKRRRSVASPSGNRIIAAASIASMHFCGAGKFAKPAFAVMRANPSRGSRFRSRILRSRARGRRAPAATSAAFASPSATAAAVASAGTSASRSGLPLKSFAGTGSPDRITLSAFSTPMSRGRRCVPPAPGRSPIFTSGRPSFAPSAATR